MILYKLRRNTVTQCLELEKLRNLKVLKSSSYVVWYLQARNNRRKILNLETFSKLTATCDCGAAGSMDLFDSVTNFTVDSPITFFTSGVLSEQHITLLMDGSFDRCVKIFLYFSITVKFLATPVIKRQCSGQR